MNEFKKINNNVSLNDDEFEFIKQSNYIEAEYGTMALSNSIYAWSFLHNSGGLNVTNILHCHYILMCNIDSRIAGKMRECDVWVGGCLKPFINEQLIRGDFDHLINLIDASIELAPKATDEVNSKIAKDLHINFEYIHPFVDGNGRVGRLLYNAHRLRLGLPIHIIKESEKQKYYEWFN